MPQDSLNPSDIKTLADLLLRSEKVKAREALCIRNGIDPNQLLLREDSDYDFVIKLIYHLNQIDDREALCRLCCDELFPIFHDKENFDDSLKNITAKLNCNQEIRHKYLNNEAVNQPTFPRASFGSESSVNLTHQPYASQTQSWLTKIGNANKKLLGSALLIAGGGVLLWHILKPRAPLVTLESSIENSVTLTKKQYPVVAGNKMEVENDVKGQLTDVNKYKAFLFIRQLDNPEWYYQGSANLFSDKSSKITGYLSDDPSSSQGPYLAKVILSERRVSCNQGQACSESEIEKLGFDYIKEIIFCRYDKARRNEILESCPTS